MEIVLVIPARYRSSRLPGKPLVNILGKSLVQRTFEQCLKAFDGNKIVIATDDTRIEEHCRDFGASVLMTSGNCLTGTDRVAEAARIVKADYYINVQGDEPLFNPEDIVKVIATSVHHPTDVINGYCAIKEEELYVSKSIPKVVFRPDGRLLYMSRSPIPGNKAGNFVKSWRQVCIYGFPPKALEDFSRLKTKTPLENEEDIEILRFLEMGYEIRMIEMSDESIAVDNPEDVAKVEAKLRSL